VPAPRGAAGLAQGSGPALRRPQAPQHAARAPKHAQDEIADDFHLIVYADDGKAAQAAREAFRRK
jgi:hypothetical protein